MLVFVTASLSACTSLAPSSTPSPTWVENDPNFNADHGHDVAETSATKLHQVSLGKFSDNLGLYTRSKFEAPDIAMITNGTLPKDAWQFYVEFVSAEVMDSIALDNPEAWNKWKTEVAPKYVSASKIKKLLKPRKEDFEGDLIFTNWFSHNALSTYMPRLIRDGGPRVFNKEMTDVKFYPQSDGLTISSTVAELLIMDDKGASQFLKDCCGFDDSFVMPEMNDGKPSVVKLIASYYWKIIDFSNNVQVNQTGLTENATKKTLSLRNF
jgi:hypothetical protein